jgi:glycosyltransferase involved in cell wall biosynthesis
VRILQVIHDFVPETMAGAEINTHKLSVDLHRRHGHEVHVFCRGWNLECEQYRQRDEELDGLQVRRIDLGKGGLPNRWRRHNPEVDAALRKKIAEFRPDLIHIQHFIYLSTDIVAIAREAGIPVIATLRNFWFRCPWGTLLYHDDTLCHRRPGHDCLSCLWPDRLGRRRNLIPWKALNPLMSAAYQRFGDVIPLPQQVREILPSLDNWEEEFRTALLTASHLHSPSHFLKGQLVDFGIPAEHVSVVPNSFRYDLTQVREKSPGQKLKIAMVGMHRLKGLHVMIDAFLQLPRGAAELHLWGQESHPAYIEEQRKRTQGHEVTFHGPYKQEQIYDVLNAADVLVVPSIWYENNPTIVLEGLATRTPVITADIGGMAELVRDGVDGMLFRAGNADSLAEKLGQLIGHPERILEMSRNARPPLTVEQCTDGVAQIYESVLQRTERATI